MEIKRSTQPRTTGDYAQKWFFFPFIFTFFASTVYCTTNHIHLYLISNTSSKCKTILKQFWQMMGFLQSCLNNDTRWMSLCEQNKLISQLLTTCTSINKKEYLKEGKQSLKHCTDESV